jgi:hypothetical protein
VAVLHLVRSGGERRLSSRRAAAAAVVLAVAACRAELQPEPDTSLQPDSVLIAQLGLALTDRVHRIRVSGGEVERADPLETHIQPGAYVEFRSIDWLVHEIIFEADSLSAEQWEFLERTDQVASPPLIDRGSRYVLAFLSAPLGRYPYTLEGNGRPGRGVIVVGAPSTPAAGAAPR